MSDRRAHTAFYSRRASRLEPGINIFGYVFAEHGVGELARGLVAVARRAGIDYAVLPYLQTGSRQAVRFEDLGAGEAKYDVNLFCVNADAMPFMVRHYGPAILEGRYNVGLWAWEVDQLPAAMGESARFLDEIWGCSRFTARAIARSVALPTFSFPPPVVLRPPAAVRRSLLGLADDAFVFLLCFDYCSIFERKNALGAIAAFVRAFPRDSGARLLIKSINGGDFRHQHDRLQEAARAHAHVQVVDGYLLPGEQATLLGACDAFVSLHRAEGFGFMMAEAMALGKPVIATGYSGNLEFMTPENSYLVPYALVPVPDGCAPYPQTSFWAEPDVAAAAAAMREIFDHRDAARAKAERARQDIAEKHSPEARADFLSIRYESIRRGAKVGRGQERAPSVAVLGFDRSEVRRGLPIDSIAEDTDAAGVEQGGARSLQQLLTANTSDRDYSQFGEQPLIERFFRETSAPFTPFFIDVGAFDGLTGSNSRFLADRGWPGIAIEPTPAAFARLQSLYAANQRVACLRCAVSDAAREAEMFVALGPEGTTDDDAWQFSQVSTLNDAWARHHRENHGYRYRSVTVEVRPLAEILETQSCPRDPAFLSIDCECEDLNVLRGMDFERFRPRLVSVECNDQNREAFAAALAPQGYVEYAHTAVNTLFRLSDERLAAERPRPGPQVDPGMISSMPDRLPNA